MLPETVLEMDIVSLCDASVDSSSGMLTVVFFLLKIGSKSLVLLMDALSPFPFNGLNSSRNDRDSNEDVLVVLLIFVD